MEPQGIDINLQELVDDEPFSEARNDFMLHIKAGLVYAGKDDDEEDQWLGDRGEWERYEELLNSEIDHD